MTRTALCHQCEECVVKHRVSFKCANVVARVLQNGTGCLGNVLSHVGEGTCVFVLVKVVWSKHVGRGGQHTTYMHATTRSGNHYNMDVDRVLNACFSQ